MTIFWIITGYIFSLIWVAGACKQYYNLHGTYKEKADPGLFIFLLLTWPVIAWITK